MSLESVAQELVVVDPSHFMSVDPTSIVPLEVSESMESIMEEPMSIEVSEPGEVSIVIEELPGAPAGTPDPEPLEVSEEELPSEEKKDDNAAGKKNEKWDWASKGAHGFITWVKERCDNVPKHSGNDSAGLERAIAYLERLDGEISKAMRMDLDGELNANQIENVRAMIDEGVERLHDRLDKIKQVKKTKRSKKKTSEVQLEGMVKEAQKITGVKGVYVMADLLTSRIARVCINGVVSAGHSIEDLYAHQVKEYGLNKREQACVRQLLEDMGFPLREDRGHFPDDEVDLASSDNYDWQANFKG